MSPWSPLFLLLLEVSWALHTPEICKSLAYLVTPKGSSVEITCSMEGLKGVYLKQRWPKDSNVIYYEQAQIYTVDTSFQGRITFSGSMSNLTITMRGLQPRDTGIFFCQYVMQMKEVPGPETFILVTDVQETWLTSVTFPIVLAVVCFFFGLGLGALCAMWRTQIKSLCWRKDKSSVCVVYEDMSYSHCNTLSTPNQYL
ncbi:T-cell antigen CD7 [Erinaceus europaeus]|uniref:T-cell antigen CD7 n=1 Tax=Erinaceus europaeus TaxID=9365 RepID=A0A1S2ZU25_ERIEU|nr:T-cell antigen CD7 [Erinaceus europaeus]